jgi:DNA repair exonuclease SbcCD nuclease subunit
MRILAISDVADWEAYSSVVDKLVPDVVALAGDVSWDSSAFFRGRPRVDHRDQFYAFLKHAGKKARVLVIAGNHDTPPGFDKKRIDRIPGCEEVSGAVVSIQGFRFLGVGYQQAHYLKEWKALISQQRKPIDFIISHSEGRRLNQLGELRPRLVIQGHFGVGHYLAHGIPTVFVAYAHFALANTATEKISIAIKYREPHHPLRFFIKPSLFKPLGSQESHNLKCFHCKDHPTLFGGGFPSSVP